MKRCPTCGRELIAFHSFKVGDRVRHAASSFGGVGIVAAIEDDGAVTIDFDMDSTHGKPWRGTYDRLWFATYPRGIVLQNPQRK